MKKFLIGIGKFFLSIISLVLCLILFVSTLATMLVADVQVATNKDNLQKVLSIVLYEPVRRPGIITAASGMDPDLSVSSSNGFSDQLLDMALGIFAGQLEGDLPFAVEDITTFVEESTVKDFLAEKSASIISDIYTGENTTTITAEEIGQLLTENKELINEHFGDVLPEGGLTDEVIQSVTDTIAEMPVIKQVNEEGIVKVLEDMGSNDSLESDNTSSGTSLLPSNPVLEALTLVRTYTSSTVLTALIGVCALLVGLLFLCAWNKPYRAMRNSGIAITLAGSIFLVPTLLALFATDVWTNIFSLIPGIGSMIGAIARLVLTLTASVCGTVTGIGLILLIGSIVVYRIMRKHKAAKAAKAAAVVDATEAEEAPVVEPSAE